jgi:hypothetical protein
MNSDWTKWRRCIVIWIYRGALIPWMLPMFSVELLVRRNCVIIVLVVTDILLLGSTLYVHTIDVFNIYLVLSIGQPTILPLPTMIIILDDWCYAKCTMIGSLRHLTVKVMLPFGRGGGGYVITDRGYPICYGFVNPIIVSFYDYHSVVWGEWVESVRKGVERLLSHWRIVSCGLRVIYCTIKFLLSLQLSECVVYCTIVCWSMTIWLNLSGRILTPTHW